MEQSLHAGSEVHECAELDHGGDASGHHRADDDRSTEVGGAGALLLLEQRAPRDDDVPAALGVFDDPEFVDAPDVVFGIRSP